MSLSRLGGRRGLRTSRNFELGQQRLNPTLDLVTDGANGGDVLSVRIFEDPFLVPPAGKDRAGIAYSPS